MPGNRKTGRHDEGGQTLVTFVIFLMSLLLFFGLAVDLGFAYITRARLSKAVDAACLTGMRNYTVGTQAQAANIASNAFALNYGTCGRDVGPVAPTVTFGVDAANNVTLNVRASATIKTYFIGILPQWKTLTVGARAQATKMNVVMSLVLDFSGSMFMSVADGGSDGHTYLPGAVTSFINQFTENADQAALVDFGSTAQVKVKMTSVFKTAIINAVNAEDNLDKTWSEGGLQAGWKQIQTVSAGANQLPVIVFFTDGFANTFNVKLGCQPSAINVGQTDPSNHKCGDNCWDLRYLDPNSGDDVDCNNPGSFSSIGGTLGSESGTTTIKAGTSETISKYNLNVWTEGQLRALQMANTIRSNNITIYCIGLGATTNDINQVFLKQVANMNDPANPTYNPNQPAGEAAFASTASDLESVFQVIASQIAVRLSQ
ncbi:MAG TPA: VWA domain-containing protein [Verrucomicrobiae bacterium]|nr:VWA domain-containing protein [Verrucomicrobiae bacterium]